MNIAGSILDGELLLLYINLFYFILIGVQSRINLLIFFRNQTKGFLYKSTQWSRK